MCDENEDRFDSEFERPVQMPYPRGARRVVKQNPDHKQVPIVINGHFTTVDKKLGPLIHILNRLGWTTRYSCQGNKKKSAYIMFEGEIAYTAIQRFVFLFPEESYEEKLKHTGFDFDKDIVPMVEKMFDATIVRTQWTRGGASSHKDVLIPSFEGSKWQVSYDSTDGRAYAGARHTVRFPSKDIKKLTMLLSVMEELIDERDQKREEKQA